MAEIDYLKIKSIYKSFIALRDSLNQERSGYYLILHTASNYDKQIDELSALSRTDYSRYKAGGNLEFDGNKYSAREFRPILSQIIGLLEGQYEFEKPQISNAPIITIDNSNRNEIQISFKTVLQVADETQDLEIKEKLVELDRELSSSNKNIDNIKAISVWLIKRSWEVFLSIAPVLLEKVGKGF